MTASLLAHRYFFAALPDPVSASRIRAWAERKIGPEGLLDARRLHVTLAITPDFSAPQPALVEALLRAGERVTTASFELMLDRLSVGTRSTALRPGHSQPPSLALHNQLADAMAIEGVEMREGWRYSPHVTLAYRQRLPSTQPVTDRGWAVNEFVLIHSLVGLTRHEVIGRWVLQPDPQLSFFSA